MPLVGSTPTRSEDFTDDLAAGEPDHRISAQKVDNEFDNIITMLSSYLLRNGANAATANLPMGGFLLTGLGEGSANGHSVRYEQLTAAVAGVMSDLVDDTTPQLGGALDGQGHDLNNLGVIFLTEQAAAEADVAGKGQFWVKDDTPNTARFTDDAGTDFQLATLTGTETLTNKTLTSPTLTTPTISDTLTVSRSGDIPVMAVRRTDNPNPSVPFYGTIASLQAPDSAGNNTTYVRLYAAVSDDTDGSEDGRLFVQMQRAGVLSNIFYVDESGMALIAGLTTSGFGVDNNAAVAAASGASIDISGLATGYTYWLECQSLKPAADAPLYLQVHDGTNFVTGAGTYQYASEWINNGSTNTSASSSSSTTFIDLSAGYTIEATSGTGWSGRIFLHAAAESGEFTMVHADGNFLRNSGGEIVRASTIGRRLTAQANARFQLIFNGSTFSSGYVQLKRMKIS